MDAYFQYAVDFVLFAMCYLREIVEGPGGLWEKLRHRLGSSKSFHSDSKADDVFRSPCQISSQKSRQDLPERRYHRAQLRGEIHSGERVVMRV